VAPLLPKLRGIFWPSSLGELSRGPSVFFYHPTFVSVFGLQAIHALRVLRAFLGVDNSPTLAVAVGSSLLTPQLRSGFLLRLLNARTLETSKPTILAGALAFSVPPFPKHDRYRIVGLVVHRTTAFQAFGLGPGLNLRGPPSPCRMGTLRFRGHGFLTHVFAYSRPTFSFHAVPPPAFTLTASPTWKRSPPFGNVPKNN